MIDRLLSDAFLQTVGAWTVLIAGGFVLFCALGFTMELIEDGYRWLRNRRLR